MGGETSKSRNSDITTLLNFGFNNYKSVTLYKKADIIKEVKFINSKDSSTPIIAKEDINITIKKSDKIDNLKIIIDIFDNSAPKNKNEVIGKLSIKDSNDNLLAQYELYPNHNIEELSFFDLFVNYLKTLF